MKSWMNAKAGEAIITISSDAVSTVASVFLSLLKTGPPFLSLAYPMTVFTHSPHVRINRAAPELPRTLFYPVRSIKLCPGPKRPGPPKSDGGLRGVLSAGVSGNRRGGLTVLDRGSMGTSENSHKGKFREFIF